MSEAEPVICQFDVVEGDDPKMEISQSSIWEPAEVDLFCMGVLFAGCLSYQSRELYTTYPADTPGFKGNGTRNRRISKKFRAVAGGCIGGDDQGVILLIPCIKA